MNLARDFDLVAETRRLIEISSVSRGETEIADYVQSRLQDASLKIQVLRIANNVIATIGDWDPTVGVVVAGHLDTVPPSPASPSGSVDPETVSGLGAVDMKGGLAVMLALAMSDFAVPIRLVFYSCEEISRKFSGLLEIQRFDSSLLVASGAILLEPTGGVIEAGCQGTAKFKVTLGGRRAHSARPWMGSNAIHRAHEFLAWLANYQPVALDIDGCVYQESLLATGIAGGIAGNVVPDQVTIDINYRFAPLGPDSVSLENVMGRLTNLLDPSQGDKLELIESAPSAPPNLSNPVIAKLLETSLGEVRAKLGWTDVAFFWEQNIPACNFGPGDPLLAHSDHEVVTRTELERCAAVLYKMFRD